MTPDSNERSLKQTQEEMAEEADRMQARLDELAERAGEAEKKAEVTRQYTDPDADDTARTEDDPAGAAGESEDAGQ
jgi:prefoldin subunit 5